MNTIAHRDMVNLSWILDDELAKADKTQRQVFIDAMDFGLHGGYAVPIHGLLPMMPAIVPMLAIIIALL
jgi:hypothetical protein